MKTVKVDFSKKIGKIKPMHAVNNGPRQKGASLSWDISDYFKEIGIPYVRLHDTEMCYGSNQFVDIHCIFPDFNADPYNEESYNFECTDKLLISIKNAGAEVYYRLGESIDHFSKKLYVNPPKDYLKWAVICEHIVRHYNYGWANGYNLGIKYWEIWNEPDNKAMWTGNATQFYELYRITANHLKAMFPEIKIGGYSASGFYMLNRENPNDWFKTLVPYMHGFFKYITDDETKAPLDFFSWHCYADVPEEVGLHAKYARELLEQYGFGDVESFLTEYNNFYSLGEQPNEQDGYTAELGATLIVAQKSPMDMMMYYDMRLTTYMNGLVYKVATNSYEFKTFPAYYSMVAFGKLYRLGEEVKSECSDGMYCLGAQSDNGQRAVMIVNRSDEDKVILSVSGAEPTYRKGYLINKENHFKQVLTGAFWNDDVVSIPKDSVLYVELF